MTDQRVTPSGAGGPGDAGENRESRETGENDGVLPGPAPRPVEPRTLVILVAGFGAVLLVALTALLPVHYAVLHPGPVLNTLGKSANGQPLISISGHTTYPTDGQLDLTTVSVAGQPARSVTLAQMLKGWLDRTSAAVPLDLVFPPGTTQKENDAQNAAEMTSSQESATAAALTTLGITYPTTLAVVGTEPGVPAAKVLKFGDVLEAVNGKAVTGVTELQQTLARQKVGADIRLRIKRGTTVSNVTTQTVGSQDDGHALLGISLDQRFQFPFTVKIQIEDIGGPSAGTMFALGIIDKLTPGDLTGGKKIAGTGTIDASGTVGPIGGIRQKLVGARRAGASYFLAPADNCSEVVKHIPAGLTVVKIGDLSQARSAVQAIAAGRASSLSGCS
jgi:PDZ domain-containing protein